MSVHSPARSTLTAIRLALGISGAVSLLVGLLILVWPGRTAEVAVAIIAIYVIVAGLIYAAMGIYSRGLHAWGRVGHILLGVLFVLAGVFALANLTAATASFALVVGVLVGILWIVEGVVSLSTLGQSESRGWTIFFAVISVLAGITLLFSPLYVALLWLFVGASLIVLGIFQIVRAITFARALRAA